MNWLVGLDPALCERLTLTLLHVIWQGTVLAVLACLVGLMMRRASAQARHGLYMLALLAMATCQRVAVPIVVGLFQPMILLPLSMASVVRCIRKGSGAHGLRSLGEGVLAQLRTHVPLTRPPAENPHASA